MTTYINFIYNKLKIHKENIFLYQNLSDYDKIKLNLHTTYEELSNLRKYIKDNQEEEKEIYDMIEINNDHTYIKCVNNTKLLQTNDVSNFILWIIKNNKKGKIYYSYNKISKYLEENINPEQIELVYEKFIPTKKNKIVIQNNNYKDEIIKLSTEYFKTNNKGVISLPNSYEITDTIIEIIKSHDNIVYITYNKEKCELIEELIKEKDKVRNTRIITNLETSESLDEFVTLCNKYCIIVPHKYIDLLENKINTKTFIVIDTIQKICHDERIAKLLNTKNKILNISTMQLTNKELYGNIIYEKNITDCIENKYMNDYKIYVSTPNINNNKIIKKSKYLYECIQKNGNMKCIIYFSTVNAIEEFIEIFRKMNEHYYFEYTIDKITYHDTKKQRKQKIEIFEKEKEISFMCSINPIEEWNEIINYDSVYITFEKREEKGLVDIMNYSLKKQDNLMKIYIYEETKGDVNNIIDIIKKEDINIINKIELLNIENNDNQNNKIEYQEKRKHVKSKIAWYEHYKRYMERLNKGEMPQEKEEETWYKNSRNRIEERYGEWKEEWKVLEEKRKSIKEIINK